MDVGRPRRLEMRTSASWFSLYPAVRGTVIFSRRLEIGTAGKRFSYTLSVGEGFLGVCA